MRDDRFLVDDPLPRTCLGGVRLVDPVTRQAVGAPLLVTARRGAAARAMVPSRNRTFVLHAFPGLGPTARWDGRGDAPDLPVDFSIDVVDPSRTFLPMSFGIRLPNWPNLDHPATVPSPNEGEDPHAVMLFSSPQRRGPAGWQAIRGHLRRSGSAEPAPWALLRLYREQDPTTPRRPIARALADGDGRFSLLFPLPAPNAPLGAAPAPPVYGVVVEASFAETNSPDEPPPFGALIGQPKAALIDRVEPPSLPVPLGTFAVEPGRDRVLQTHGPAEPARRSFLYLQPD